MERYEGKDNSLCIIDGDNRDNYGDKHVLKIKK